MHPLLFSLSVALSFCFRYPVFFFLSSARVGVEQPSASFVTGTQGETSTIKPTILNEQAGATNPRGGETHVTAASRPSVGSGGELVLAVAWLDACTGQHAFREGGWKGAGGRDGERGTTSEYGLTVFVDEPSTRYSP